MHKTQPQRFHRPRTVLAFSMMIMGACGIVYEYVLGVLGNYLMGSSYEQIFVVIGIMMFAMGIGAVVQRQLTGDLLDYFIMFEWLLGLLGGVSTLVIYLVFVYTASYLVVLYAFAFIIGLLIGLEIPLLIRINSEYASSLRVNLSDILCMDYVGSLIGALLFTYVLLTRFSISRIAILLGIVNILLALGASLYFRPLIRRRTTLLVLPLFSLVLFGFLYTRADRIMIHLEQRCYQDPIVHRETSRYQHLVLTRKNDRLRLYINGHLQFSSCDEAVYHELLAHVPMLLAPSRENVLILGGGDGLALREVLKYPDVRDVTLVDIDPAVIRLAAGHPELIRLNRAAFHDARLHTRLADGVHPAETITVTAPPKNRRLHTSPDPVPLAEVSVYTIDADQFLKSVSQNRYDVAILDFPDPKSVELAKLFSIEFYHGLQRCLKPGALVAVQSTSPHRAEDVFVCIGRTLEAAGFQSLPYQDYLPSFGDWGWHLAWCDRTGPATMQNRISALDEIPIITQYISPKVLKAAFVFGKNQLQPNNIKPNTQMQPVMIKYYRQGFRD